MSVLLSLTGKISNNMKVVSDITRPFSEWRLYLIIDL